MPVRNKHSLSQGLRLTRTFYQCLQTQMEYEPIHEKLAQDGEWCPFKVGVNDLL